MDKPTLSNVEQAQAVIDWLRAHLQLRGDTIVTLDTAINTELGVDGDDGIELITAFGQAHAVDVSGFPYAEHFGPELGVFSLGFAFKRAKLKPLPVRALVQMLAAH